jgi:peptide/nickel transport system permease protein
MATDSSISELIGHHFPRSSVPAPDEPSNFEAFSELLSNYYVQDAIVTVLAVVLITAAWRMSRREFWRRAAREIMQNRMAMVSLIIISCYVAIAVLDSVGWHPPLVDENGEVRRDAAGEVITDHRGKSLLDYLLVGLQNSKEKTYSAPFAKRHFTSEIVPDDNGVPQQVYKPLQHPGKHVCGTDKVGIDVLYMALKGVRTGVIIGALTTLLAIPFAIFFGVIAGYFGGWVDDIVQYIYTVLASIPSILLIVAFMILFGRGLLQLCVVMGITSWTGLCRVLRGETMKLREMEFVQAAEAMGVPRWKILARHIVPNVMHVVLITAVLAFSNNVLAEAVLTYIGVGVDPETYSWGRMINDARTELARDPIIWWKICAVFVFMIGLVLPANIFGDALRDALDPRLRTQ